MLLNTSSSWSNVAVYQSDHVKVVTVAAWGINFLALCSAPVVVVLPDDADNPDVDNNDEEENE